MYLRTTSRFGRHRRWISCATVGRNADQARDWRRRSDRLVVIPATSRPHHRQRGRLVSGSCCLRVATWRAARGERQVGQILIGGDLGAIRTLDRARFARASVQPFPSHAHGGMNSAAGPLDRGSMGSSTAPDVPWVRIWQSMRGLSPSWPRGRALQPRALIEPAASPRIETAAGNRNGRANGRGR